MPATLRVSVGIIEPVPRNSIAKPLNSTGDADDDAKDDVDDDDDDDDNAEEFDVAAMLDDGGVAMVANRRQIARAGLRVVESIV